MVRIDTPGEADYYRNGGILQYVLRSLIAELTKHSLRRAGRRCGPALSARSQDAITRSPGSTDQTNGSRRARSCSGCLRRARRGHGDRLVAIAFLTGEISAEEAFGAELPKLVAITGRADPGGWSAPVDPVNYYWVRVWAARVLLYVWRDDAVDALQIAAADPAWRVREHVARITAERELGQLVDALLPGLTHELPRVRAVTARAVGAAGEAEHAEALQNLLNDRDNTVRAAAEKALDRLEARLDRSFH